MRGARLGAAATRRREVAQFVGATTEHGAQVLEQQVQLECQHSTNQHSLVEQLARPAEQLIDVGGRPIEFAGGALEFALRRHRLVQATERPVFITMSRLARCPCTAPLMVWVELWAFTKELASCCA